MVEIGLATEVRSLSQPGRGERSRLTDRVDQSHPALVPVAESFPYRAGVGSEIRAGAQGAQVSGPGQIDPMFGDDAGRAWRKHQDTIRQRNGLFNVVGDEQDTAPLRFPDAQELASPRR